MAEVLIMLLALAGLAAGAMVAVTVVTVHGIRRRSRVVPSIRSEAPLYWMASPLPPARLHRSLVVSVANMRVAVPRPGRRHRPSDWTALQTVAHELEQHAAAVDRDLARAARLRGVARRAAISEIGAQVVEIEKLADRIVASATNAARAASIAAGVSPTPMQQLHRNLDAMEAAWRELADLHRPAESDGAELGGRQSLSSP